ncbi:hypothetical protein Tco_1044990 [Tanacetum coccineum]|uniref:Uncharacterized protein n=1 Tax=Tanacetum coccineum TaxID=301880 RepID=A0ABQ5GSA0_9ASTR
MTRSLVTKKTDISYVRSSRNSNLMNMLQMMSVHISSGLVLNLEDASLKAPFLKVQKGVTPSREKESIRWQKRIFLHLNLQDEMNRSFIAQNSYRLERETFSKIYRSYRRILSSTFQPYRSLMHDNIVPKPDLALELGKSISLTKAEEEAVAREVHATHTRIIIAIEVHAETTCKNCAGPYLSPCKKTILDQNSGKLHVFSAGKKPNPEHMDDEFPRDSLPKCSSKNLKLITDNLRVARLEQEMSEVKKTDHSADVLASIKSQVPTVVDKYLGTKLDDALSKILKRHTADLIEKYSALPGPESIKNQESEKSPKEIIRIKREQGEEKQDSTYSIRSTDKVALEEFDLKSALFKHMNKNKTANRNPANYHLYHALMEALIADEDAIDKSWAVKVKDHKRKHDSDDEEDDDDDEGPSAGSNQGRSAKRRRPESAASGSAQPPSKDDHQSSKKPRESDASASIQHPALTSTGWQITDTRDDVVNSLMHMLPNNIQITDTSLMHMLNLNPSPHKEDSLVLLSEIPLLCQRRGSNEGTGNLLGVPDESTVISRASSEGTGLCAARLTAPVQISSGPAPSLMTPGYISSGLVQNLVSSTPYVPPSKKDYEILFQPLFDEYFNSSTNELFSPDRVNCTNRTDPVIYFIGVHKDVGFNPLVHSFCALSTLRRSGLRTASAAAKPCQGDSLEFYLITGRIPTVAAAGQRHVNSQPHAHTSYS